MQQFTRYRHIYKLAYIYISPTLARKTHRYSATYTLALTGAKALNIDWHLLGGKTKRYDLNEHLQMGSISTYISDSPRTTSMVICPGPIANLSIICSAIYASLLWYLKNLAIY